MKKIIILFGMVFIYSIVRGQSSTFPNSIKEYYDDFREGNSNNANQQLKIR